ncbi:unnamed protein product [Linum tenue]|uniref:Uncharacterized protein n=1 Tax=Linum tenue TaxID=586396 RepID=A0AAV0HJH3_9ROSI|nr:unnamed protein product [Linum tenue]
MMKKPTRWTWKLRRLEKWRRRYGWWRQRDGRDSSSASSRLDLQTLDVVDLAENDDASGVGVWGESQH